MTIYNKLVRDLIPDIINQKNLATTNLLDPKNHLTEIKRKLYEEVEEFNSATNRRDSLEELADILELIHAALPFYEATYTELEKIRLLKKEKKGGFEKGIFLIEVKDK